MTNYEKNLQLFFAELIAYLERVKAQIQPGDIQRLSDVNYGLMVAGTVASNPQRYANHNARISAKLEHVGLIDALTAADGRDDTAFVLYRQALQSMTYYFFSKNSVTRLRAKNKIANALKAIKSKGMSR